MDLDLHSEYDSVRFLSPVTQTNSDTAIASQILDLANYVAAEFLLSIGALTDADATFAVSFAESNDSGMSGSNAVAAADMIGAPAAFTFASDNTEQKWGYKGNKRYVQLTITPTNNNSGSASLGCVAFLKKRKTGSTL